MACMVPDADKSSADSGKGQSDDDVFSHEGKIHIIMENLFFALCIYVCASYFNVYFPSCIIKRDKLVSYRCLLFKLFDEKINAIS